MRKLLVVVSLTTLPFSALLSAQEVKTIPPPKPKVVNEAPPKKPLLKRLFGAKEAAAPAPAPTSTAEKPAPKPVAETTPKPKPKARTKSQAESKPSSSKKTASKEKKPTRGAKTAATEKKDEEKKDEAAATEPSEETKPAAESNETAATTKGGKKPAPAKPEKSATEGLDDAEKYKSVKATALEDPAIKDLKSKADGAINETEAHAASVAYNRALFRKIREIEPSLDGYVDKLEAAMMKRLSGEKNGE